MQSIISCCKICLLGAMVLLFSAEARSQATTVNPGVEAVAVKVNVVQELQLGAFTQGSTGGTINILPDGTRLGTGTVVPLNFGAGAVPLILEIQGPKGSIVSMLSETTRLTGSNGGSMMLKITETSPPMPFIITDDAPAKSIIKIGAELMVGNAQQSPPGNYSGSLNVSFVVE